MTNLLQDYHNVRGFSQRIAEPLSAEDCAIQSMPDVSPTRWHLAHTTWFFETFILKTMNGYTPFDDSFEYLFNSYYNTVGEQYPRDRRGLISRPGLEETQAYRRHVDQAMSNLIESDQLDERTRQTLEVGLHHEQQHQELMLTDIKHVLSCNPLSPCYQAAAQRESEQETSEWSRVAGGVVQVGHETSSFCFDNELPRHKVYLDDFQIARRTVTVGEYLEFMKSGGYEQPNLWQSLGWKNVQSERWQAPMYWRRRDDRWMIFTLAGLRPLNVDEPVCHVSYFEADAFARWAGYRLPTEFEWEHAAASLETGDPGASRTVSTQLMQDGYAMHPQPSSETTELAEAYGNVWEWTGSQYTAYPGYQPLEGALGEYNGKFMCNQFVLRGGSCATPAGHIRPSYRNFFPPETRWQFAGIRLAKSTQPPQRLAVAE